MSTQKTIDLKALRSRLKRSSVDKKLLTIILRRPSQYIQDRLSGLKPFTYSELLSISDLIGCEIQDLMS